MSSKVIHGVGDTPTTVLGCGTICMPTDSGQLQLRNVYHVVERTLFPRTSLNALAFASTGITINPSSSLTRRMCPFSIFTVKVRDSSRRCTLYRRLRKRPVHRRELIVYPNKIRLKSGTIVSRTSTIDTPIEPYKTQISTST